MQLVLCIYELKDFTRISHHYSLLQPIQNEFNGHDRSPVHQSAGIYINRSIYKCNAIISNILAFRQYTLLFIKIYNIILCLIEYIHWCI